MGVAEALSAGYFEIKNPPVRRVTQAQYNALGTPYINFRVAVTGTGSNDPGERVLEFQDVGGTRRLAARVPNPEERGYPTDKRIDHTTYYVMDWNDEEGWPAVLGFRFNRLFASGSGDRGSEFTLSTAGDALDFLLYTRRDATEDEISEQIDADFAMRRSLDSFSQIVEVYADNGLVIFTERGEWSIQGELTGRVLRGQELQGLVRYSSYSTERNAGVGNIDNQIFFVAQTLGV